MNVAVVYQTKFDILTFDTAKPRPHSEIRVLGVILSCSQHGCRPHATVGY